MAVEIYINEELVDVPEGGVKFSASYSIADIQKLDQRNSDITKTFTLPGTKRNKRIFGFADDLNSASAIDQTVKPDVRIERDGTTVFKGILKITDIQIQNTLVMYKCVGIGTNGAWKQLIKDKKLTELDLSDQDHIPSTSLINTSETLDDSRDYVYPLINYGAWNGGAVVNLSDRYPATRMRRIVNQIFNEVGYRVESSFLNSDFFSRLFMPFTNRLISESQDQNSNKNFRASGTVPQYFGNLGAVPFDQPDVQTILFDNDSTNGNFDNGLFTTTLNEYQPTSLAVVNIKFQCRVFATNSTFRLRIKKGAGATFPNQVLASIEFTGQDDPATPGLDESILTVETGFIQVQAGERYLVEGEVDYPSPVGETSPAISIDSAVMYNVVQWDGTIRLNETIPDDYQLEFLQGLKTDFNLMFDTDFDSRTVTIEPYDDYYTDEVVDWTNKLDLNSNYSIKYLGANVSKNIVYTHADDSDDQPVQDIIEQDGSFDETTSVSTNQFARDGQTTVTSYFAPTLMATASTIGFITTYIPKMWNENPLNEVPSKNTQYKTRYLYYDGVQPMNAGESWRWTNITRIDYPRFLFYDEVNDNDTNLMFRTLRRSHGLFEKYYRNSTKILNEGRLFVGKFKLNAVDINNLDFRKRIKLTLNGEQLLFKLNAVKNYTGEGLTTVELVTEVGTQQLSDLTTEADDPKILPPDFQPDTPSEPVGLLATTDAGIVQVYSTDPINGNVFWVQTPATQSGSNGG